MAREFETPAVDAGNLLSVQEVSFFFKFTHLPCVGHNDASPFSLSPAVLPHDAAEEEGAGPRRRLQQSGVSCAALRSAHTRRKQPKHPIKNKTVF